MIPPEDSADRDGSDDVYKEFRDPNEQDVEVRENPSEEARMENDDFNGEMVQLLREIFIWDPAERASALGCLRNLPKF